MRVVILGSGVVGVASAWYLNQAGHEVTVIDREPGAALETSAANAGQISPGYAAPWAAPGVPLKAIKWMFQRHAPLAVRLDGTQFQLKWMWQMLRNCDTSHYMENKGRMVRLAEYSRDCLKALRAETNIQYEGRQGGTLQLFRTEQQYENATRDIAVLEDAGVPYQLLESSRLAEVEPALAEVAHDLTVDFAQRHGAQFIVKGVRSVKDFEFEREQADINRRLTGIETVVFYALPGMDSVSSSVVRELKNFGRDVDSFLPKRI